ncbi:MAG TPA: DoxX family membrane protein [Acidimicrobiales bacterium]|nr:DoxX family membrane protein [Acidimicrobiales bacterium]
MTTVQTGPPISLDALADAVPLEPLPSPPEPVTEPDEATLPPALPAAEHPADAAVRTDATELFLRVGLAFVFVYAAATSLVDPEAAATYFPRQLPGDLVVDVLLPAFAVYEILLAMALLSGRFTYIAALLAAVTLAGIVVVNADAFAVLFRNVAITCAALALAVESKDRRPGRTN